MERLFLLSLSRPRLRPAHTSIARTVLATMLLVVCLASAVPFSSLASNHECSMACCVGKPSHMAGSCSAAFSEAEEPAAEPDKEEAAHASPHMMHGSGASLETTPAAAHQEAAAEQHSTHHSTSARAGRRKPHAASQAVMTTPCSTECSSVAVYGSSQVRRPRDAASLTIAVKPRPHGQSLLARAVSRPLTEANGHRNPTRPRGPPFHLSDLSA
jgi:hypothetical protein